MVARNRRFMLKVAIAGVLVLVVWLVMLEPMVKAERLHQTVPTMPPDTATSTSGAPANTPTHPAQATPTRMSVTQATGVAPTLTAPATVSATVGATATGTAAIGSATPELGSTTQPGATAQATGTGVSSSTAVPAMGARGGTSQALYYLVGGGVALIVVIGVGWAIRRRKDQTEARSGERGGRGMRG